MDMSIAKTNLVDLMSQMAMLETKFNIREFDKEIVTEIPIYKFIIESWGSGANLEEFVPKYTQEEYENGKKQFNILKEKYNYDAYLKEGYTIRQQFISSRKNYMMNKNRKFLEIYDNVNLSKSSKMNPVEKIAIDINKEYLFSKWMDNHLRNMKPKSMFMKFETIKGEVKEIEVSYKSVEITEEFVEAPLIDRLTGSCAFDRFLLHSFYNIKTQQYEYVPVKLIMSVIDNG